MGAAYPGPGLFSKFYDQDMQPLVEVVRDTVGRHDTFALACTAKYYEDMGYPGHVNCTDNFNAALAPYTIQSRRGWPAVNFFYNTRIDLNNVLVMDEPWSRPGDYVLLKALTDLVCLSSACPDDIDPANGWEPTEIQVRVYPERYRFFQRNCAPDDGRRRTEVDEGDGLSPANLGPDSKFRGIPRFLAAVLLYGEGRRRGVLRLS